MDQRHLLAGARVRLRGNSWIVQSLAAHADCQSLRLTGCGSANRRIRRTFLLPFERLRPADLPSRVRVVSRRRWTRRLAQVVASAHPFGGLRAAASAAIDLLPFQLEPALAMLRHARLRVLIADEVGLGKTIQSGMVISELAHADGSLRCLILSPAGLRRQWQDELLSKFAVETTLADADWLVASARDLPPDVNPWSLPGIYVASLDLVKRPEVLRALEDVTWDLTIVDEAHGAGLRTARLSAAQAVGARSRRVILLTATPPDDDPDRFAAIAAIGRMPGEQPIVAFRRTRADVGITARRKSRIIAVRLSEAESAMHRLLERYTSLVWQEAGARGDYTARLAAMILRKRALSGAGALAITVKRRLTVLGTSLPPLGHQLSLPLRDEDPLDDEVGDTAIAASGLSDVALEREWLQRILTVADDARRSESKLRVLTRLLARIGEPAIVFTEYRDTLARIAAALPHDLQPQTLHGALSPRDRTEMVRRFNQSGTLLLATDAASEGLNLHERSRLVVHFELPWTPARLEQRTGRVDRLGQSKAVHELLMVANDTAERFVLAPLLRRARSAADRSARLLRALSESAVADAVIGESALPLPPTVDAPAPTVTLDLAREASEECSRLSAHRRLVAQCIETAAHRCLVALPFRAALQPTTTDDRNADVLVNVSAVRRRRGTVVVLLCTLRYESGELIHSELRPVRLAGRPPNHRTAHAIRDWASRFIETHERLIGEELLRRGLDAGLTAPQRVASALIEAAAARERWIARGFSSTAERLVQAGLFDRRSVRQAEARANGELFKMDSEERCRYWQAARLRSAVQIVAIGGVGCSGL